MNPGPRVSDWQASVSVSGILDRASDERRGLWHLLGYLHLDRIVVTFDATLATDAGCPGTPSGAHLALNLRELATQLVCAITVDLRGMRRGGRVPPRVTKVILTLSPLLPRVACLDRDALRAGANFGRLLRLYGKGIDNTH